MAGQVLLHHLFGIERAGEMNAIHRDIQLLHSFHQKPCVCRPPDSVRHAFDSRHIRPCNIDGAIRIFPEQIGKRLQQHVQSFERIGALADKNPVLLFLPDVPPLLCIKRIQNLAAADVLDGRIDLGRAGIVPRGSTHDISGLLEQLPFVSSLPDKPPALPNRPASSEDIAQGGQREMKDVNAAISVLFQHRYQPRDRHHRFVHADHSGQLVSVSSFCANDVQNIRPNLLAQRLQIPEHPLIAIPQISDPGRKRMIAHAVHLAACHTIDSIRIEGRMDFIDTPRFLQTAQEILDPSPAVNPPVQMDACIAPGCRGSQYQYPHRVSSQIS